jgi:hypothetical protein
MGSLGMIWEFINVLCGVIWGHRAFLIIFTCSISHAECNIIPGTYNFMLNRGVETILKHFFSVNWMLIGRVTFSVLFKSETIE